MTKKQTVQVPFTACELYLNKATAMKYWQWIGGVFAFHMNLKLISEATVINYEIIFEF